jgi:hypothetical protein
MLNTISSVPITTSNKTFYYVAYYTSGNWDLEVTLFSKTSKELFMKLRLDLNRKTLWVYVFAILFAGCHHAQDITGNWQGTLIVPHGRPLRIVLQFTRDDSGTRKATCSIPTQPRSSAS